MMFLWVILIIALIYYLGRENGYFNSHRNNHNYKQQSNHSKHQKDPLKFSNRGYNRDHKQADIIDINNDDQALKIARKRYAEGEITKKEFEEIKKNLKN